MSSDDKYAIGALVFLFVLLILMAFGILRYKFGVEEALKDFFSQCVAINENVIQCPHPNKWKGK